MSGGRDAQRFEVCNCEVCGLAFFTRAARDGHQAAHTQADADREEVRTDGSGPEAFEQWVGEECPECGVEIDPGSLRSNGWALEHKNPEAHPQAGHHVIGDTIGDVADEPIADGWGVPLAGDPPDRDVTVDDLDDTLVADPESGTRYVVSVRSGELTLFAGGDPREGVEHETPASLWHQYQHGQYYAPDPDRSPWPVLDALVGDGRRSA